MDAKLLYSLLLDRKTMANMNGWIDQYGTAYVIYPKSEMKKHLNTSRYRVDMALEEMEKCGQMVGVTQPNPGRPCQIYVKDITGNYEEDMEENAMCMMMKDSNNENGKQKMRPCMGIPGMHGIAVVLDEEEFLKLLIWMKKRQSSGTKKKKRWKIWSRILLMIIEIKSTTPFHARSRK